MCLVPALVLWCVYKRETHTGTERYRVMWVLCLRFVEVCMRERHTHKDRETESHVCLVPAHVSWCVYERETHTRRQIDTG